MTTVDISRFREKDARIFSDRDAGVRARKELNIEQLENKGSITILIPEDTWGINPSFFGGLFESSIKKMRNSFWDNYRFEYVNHKTLKESIQNSIEYAFNRTLEELEENE